MILRWMWDTDPRPDASSGRHRRRHRASGVHDGPASHSWWATVVLLLVAAATVRRARVLVSVPVDGVARALALGRARCRRSRIRLGSAALLALAAAAIAYASRALGRDAQGARWRSRSSCRASRAVRGVRRRPLRDARHGALAARLELWRHRVRAHRPAGRSTSSLVAMMIVYTLARAWARRLDRVRRATFDNTMLIGYYTVAQGARGARPRARLSALGRLARWPRALDVRWPARLVRARSSGPCTSRRSTASRRCSARAARATMQWLGIGVVAWVVGAATLMALAALIAVVVRARRAADRRVPVVDHGRRRRAGRARDRLGGAARAAGARMRMMRAMRRARCRDRARRVRRAGAAGARRRRAMPSAAACCCASTAAGRVTAFPASRQRTATSDRRSTASRAASISRARCRTRRRTWRASFARRRRSSRKPRCRTSRWARRTRPTWSRTCITLR